MPALETISNEVSSLPEITVSVEGNGDIHQKQSKLNSLRKDGEKADTKIEETMSHSHGPQVNGKTNGNSDMGENGKDGLNDYVLVVTEPNSTETDTKLPQDDRTNDGPSNCCLQCVARCERRVATFFHKNKSLLWKLFKILLLLGYFTYYIISVIYKFGDEGSIVLTVIAVFIIIKIALPYLRRSKCLISSCSSIKRSITAPSAAVHKTRIKYVLYVLALVAMSVYLGIDVLSHSVSNAQALAGIATLIFLCFLTSARPSRVNWHPVFWGFIIQFVFAIITLRTEPGYRIFKWIGDLVNEFVDLSEKGSNFVLGASFRATAPGFFFETAGVVVFFNSCIFVLDYIGVLELVILSVGRVLGYCLQTGPIESVVAAANIFIGLSEAPLLVRPYLPVITKSELHAIMTCGFASISGAFMAMFIAAGAPPTHLLTACLISAPAALAISKLMYPETEFVDFTKQRDIRTKDDTSPKTCMQAISDGATFSIKIVATIMVNMMAFVSILNLVDTLLIWIGERAGKDDLTFNFISSYLFYPVSWLMGIPSEDCLDAGYLLGLKMLATPFVAYKDLGVYIENRDILEDYIGNSNGTWHRSGDDIILDATNTTLVGGVLQPRTEAILTYAMCGLSAFPAIGFTMGTLIPMSPERKPDVVKLVLRAFVAGNLANLATGAVAGVMFKGD